MLTILTYNAAEPAREPIDRDPGFLTLASGTLRVLRRALVRPGKGRYPAPAPVPFAWL